MQRTIIAMMVTVLFLADPAGAMDFSTALDAAINNIPAGADVAGMGNAWTATPEFSSNNPAVAAIEDAEGKMFAGISGTYGLIHFNHGPGINLYSITGTARLPVGVLQVSGSLGNSGMHGTDFDADFKVSSVTGIDIQYGLKVAEDVLRDGDSLYAGIGYAYSRARLVTNMTLPMEEIGPLPASITTESQSHAVGAGVVYRPTSEINIGLFGRRSWDSSSDTLEIPEAEYVEKTDTNSHGNLYRMGVGVQITPLTFVAVDYQHVDLSGHHFDQLFAGVEQGIVKDLLYLYGGWAADGPTAGLGLYLKKGGLNISYMRHIFKDLEEYFGAAEVYMVSAYLSF